MLVFRKCEPEVVLQVACGIISGESYPQLEESFRQAGFPIREDEANFATIYVITFLTQKARLLPEEVADFCDRTGVPMPRDVVLETVRQVLTGELKLE